MKKNKPHCLRCLDWGLRRLTGGSFTFCVCEYGSAVRKDAPGYARFMNMQAKNPFVVMPSDILEAAAKARLRVDRELKAVA